MRHVIARGTAPAILVLLLLLFAAPAGAGSPSPAGTDDLIVLSGRADVGTGESAGQVVIFNGPATIEGRVGGDVVAFNGDVAVSGLVTGDAVAVNGRVTVRAGGRVEGDVIARSGTEIAGSIGGSVRDVGDLLKGAPRLLGWFAWWIPVTVSTLLLGLLFLWLAPRGLQRIANAAREQTGVSVLTGLLLFVGLPLVAGLLLVSLVAAPFGIGLLLAFGLLYSAGYVAGMWALGLLLIPSRRVPAFLAAWAILRGLALVPWVAGVSWFLTATIGLGAAAVAIGNARREPAAPATGYHAADM
jgi:hypothetical protein